MEYIADLHIHSRYSRSTSKDMDIAHIAAWAKTKGIALVGTGDFTHPRWLAELERHLEDAGDGIYRHAGIDFILSAEVANIYRAGDRSRRVHMVLLAPSFKAAREINRALGAYGRLASDGRPILKLACDEMVRRLSAIDPGIVFIPAHVWTPYFGLFGSKSGFDSPEECFGEELPKVLAIETGMSSDPAMNWRWSGLDRFCITSHSDAHSPAKLGREATVFYRRVGYREIVEILRTRDRKRLLYTIEFFPEEGKYHWDGHRSCGVSLAPSATKRKHGLCPVCGKPVTVGVMHRVADLADRKEGFVPKAAPPFKRAVPLAEIIADLLGVGAGARSVEREYRSLIARLGPELGILLDVPDAELRANAPAKIAGAILKVRSGKVRIEPGYDGTYGVIRIA